MAFIRDQPGVVMVKIFEQRRKRTTGMTLDVGSGDEGRANLRWRGTTSHLALLPWSDRRTGPQVDFVRTRITGWWVCKLVYSIERWRKFDEIMRYEIHLKNLQIKYQIRAFLFLISGLNSKRYLSNVEIDSRKLITETRVSYLGNWLEAIFSFALPMNSGWK